MKRAEAVPVRPGQVWADCDWRNAGRTVRVESVDSSYAHCVTLTFAGGGPAGERQTRILLSRMRPTSTGFRLVREADDAAGRA